MNHQTIIKQGFRNLTPICSSNSVVNIDLIFLYCERLILLGSIDLKRERERKINEIILWIWKGQSNFP